ncbi:hypothetical protein ACSFA8_20180 [Variovorax sp. RT4R15]|uniref:hypothetical protein n=1 Tax=Variovorax sp. RT4R15 TaxID=3443737 RepID=UPI003F4476BC
MVAFTLGKPRTASSPTARPHQLPQGVVPVPVAFNIALRSAFREHVSRPSTARARQKALTEESATVAALLAQLPAPAVLEVRAMFDASASNSLTSHLSLGYNCRHCKSKKDMHPLDLVSIERTLRAIRYPTRDPLKRSKDRMEADLVEELVQTHDAKLIRTSAISEHISDN